MYRKLHSPLFHVILYIAMLAATPFLLLQNYLQSAIGVVSEFKFPVGSLNFPYVLLAAILVLSAILILVRKNLKGFHFILILVLLIMISLGQFVADFYFNHNFWDLQHNWHYFAYGLFAYICYRYFNSIDLSPARTILYSLLLALLVSAFDEGLQVFISSRIFDIGDIAKDAWGMMMGQVLVQFSLNVGALLKQGWVLRHRRIRDYFNHPISLLLLEILFVYLLLIVSSLLTDIEYWKHIILLTTGISLIIFFAIYFSQFKIFRYILIGAVTAALAVQLFFFIRYKDENIIHNSYGLTVYKGIPIPFFDVMIFENGFFRLVDKKRFFNKRDQVTIKEYTTNILLIGTGSKGLGGNGFPKDEVLQFVYNTFKKRGMQVIALPTPQACREYNRMKEEGKKIVFIIHNTF